jgi:Xaa-Pro aminopeptidase
MLIEKTEMEGFRQCHIRDGAALVRYFAWLEEVLKRGEQWTEYNAGEELEKFRKWAEGTDWHLRWRLTNREMLGFKGLSFDTISSTGSNAGKSKMCTTLTRSGDPL